MLLEFVIKISCKVSFFCVFISIKDVPVLNLAILLMMIILMLSPITNKYWNILSLYYLKKLKLKLKAKMDVLYSTSEFKYIKINRYLF